MESVMSDMGRISFYDQVLRLERFGRGSEALEIGGFPLEIPFVEIKQLYLRNSSYFFRGYLTVDRKGEVPVRGLLASVKSPLSIPFAKDQQVSFEQFYEKLMNALEQQKKHNIFNDPVVKIRIPYQGSEPEGHLIIEDEELLAGEQKDSRELVARYSTFLKPNLAQKVFGGGMVVGVVPPTEWIYRPATREQEQQAKILAIYHQPGVEMGTLHLYVTLIPLELRAPMSLDDEIDADIRTSQLSGLIFAGVNRFRTQGGEAAAIISWKGEGFFRTVGLITCELGVVMVPGTSRVTSNNQKLADAVFEVTKNATIFRQIHVADERD
jgi:hypothetical protein